MGLLRDARDRPLLDFAVRASGLLPLGVAVFLAPAAVWPVAAAAFVAFYLWHLEPFITMFHDVNHRRLFRAEWLNTLLFTVFGPIYGSTPHTYFLYHVLMHHPANNMAEDVSTTLPYQRDSFRDFARYYVHFFVGLFSVRRYLVDHYPRGTELARNLVLGELGWWLLVAVALAVDPASALVVFVVPLLVTRSLFAVGNWGEHAFIDLSAPDNPFRNSTNLVGERVNRRSFNVGYHIDHHVRPGAHFSTHPAWFEANLERFGAEDAVVLRDLTYPDLWWMLMRHDYDGIADRFVQLPGAPERSRDELKAMLRSRVAAGRFA